LTSSVVQEGETTAGLGRMGFAEHLRELRKRLLYSVAAILIAAFGCFGFAPELFELLRQPLAAVPDQQMIVIGPLEMFITYLKLSVLAGLFIAFPWVLLQIWWFIAPGLYQHEKRWVAPFVLLGTIFFVGGGAFAYLVVLPMGFEYLVAMVPESVATQFSVAIYFSLVVRLLLAFGVVFELPIIMCLLSAVGIFGPQAYASVRKYWVVVAVAVAAFLTPPDPFTQMMMAIPLVLFFELGILGSKLLYRDDRA